MKLDLNFDLLDLTEKPIVGENCGQIIAATLARDTKGDALKYWEWALKLQKGEALELDTSDSDHLKNFIKTHEGLTNILKAQALGKFKK